MSSQINFFKLILFLIVCCGIEMLLMHTVSQPIPSNPKYSNSSNTSSTIPSLIQTIKSRDTIIGTLTVYHAVPEQTNANPSITADGSIIKDRMNPPNNWVAVPRNWLKEGLSFGDSIELICKNCPYSGVYEVHDVMNNRYTNTNTVDVLIGEWDTIGKWDNIKIIKY